MATSVEETSAHLINAPETSACPNCAATLAGEYCHDCGQKKIDPNEFSVRRFVGRVLTEFIDLESNKVFKTVRVMILKPGLLAQEYLSGRRATYIGPVKLYLTFSAIYFLFAWGALGDIRGGGAERAARNPRTIATARQRGVDPRALADKAYEKAEKWASGFRFFSVLISGLFLSLLYIGLKKYYVEHLIFSLYYYSFDFFCKSLFALFFIVVAAVGWRLPGRFLDTFYVVGFVYILFALRRVYQQSWKMTLLKSVVLYFLETALFIAVNIAGFIIAFALV